MRLVFKKIMCTTKLVVFGRIYVYTNMYIQAITIIKKLVHELEGDP